MGATQILYIEDECYDRFDRMKSWNEEHAQMEEHHEPAPLIGPELQRYAEFMLKLMQIQHSQRFTAIKQIDGMSLLKQGKSVVKDSATRELRRLKERGEEDFMHVMYYRHPVLFWVRVLLENRIGEMLDRNAEEREIRRCMGAYDTLIYCKTPGISSARKQELLETRNGFQLMAEESSLFESAYLATIEAIKRKFDLHIHTIERNESTDKRDPVAIWESILQPYPQELTLALTKNELGKANEIMEQWSEDLQELNDVLDNTMDADIEVRLRRVYNASNRKFLKFLEKLRLGGEMPAPSKIHPCYIPLVDSFHEEEVLDRLVKDLKLTRKQYPFLHPAREKLDAAMFFIDEVLGNVVKSGAARMILNTRPGFRGYYHMEDREAFVYFVLSSINSSIRAKLKSLLRFQIVRPDPHPIAPEKSRRMNDVISMSLRRAHRKYGSFMSAH